MFHVVSYSRDAFVGACLHEKLTARSCSQNNHTKYYCEYLEKLDCSTILIESDYVDRDYLVDFAAYYARCFQKYRRKCKRLHFFKEEFTQNDFNDIISGRTKKKISEIAGYLGFIVVKPLPIRFFGRSCLITYPESSGRKYPCLRDYKVNIAGDDLVIRSLAFQEQDREVAACATSAIWSALHKTAHEFGYRIPTPSEITKLADDGLATSKRNIPNNGLTVEEIRQAIKRMGLEAEIFPVRDSDGVKKILYSYLSFGLPAILGYNLKTQKDDLLGGHAVTATGFSLDMDGSPPTLRSSRMTKVYLHDDQAGPFSRARFTAGGGIETGFPHPHGPVKAHPIGADDEGNDPHYLVLVPVDPKMRIPVNEVFEYLQVLIDVFIKMQLNMNIIEWEVRATSSHEYKREISYLEDYHDDKERIRARPLPKFLWLIRAHVDEVALFDLLLDATSIRDDDLLATSLFYDKEVQEAIWHGYFSDDEVKNALLDSFEERYVHAIERLFRPPLD